MMLGLSVLFEVVEGGGGNEGPTKVPYCHDKESFLGVGNPTCIMRNAKTTLVLIACIILISVGFEQFGSRAAVAASHAVIKRSASLAPDSSQAFFAWQPC